MSFDVFVCRFENGEPTPLDMRAAHEVLGPMWWRATGRRASCW